MNVSVAMTTYNGQKFVENQIKSILNQTIIPNEIVIIDDCSSDATREILQRIVGENPHIDWKIIFNEKNLGWKSNFAKAIRNTTGDIVFLADQDDVWFENKVEEMIKQFTFYPEILVLASKYESITWNDSLELSLSSCEQEEGRSERVLFDKFFYMSHFPGCSMAFKGICRKWFESSFWNENQPHDEFLWTMAKTFDGAFFYSGKLMFYIRHANAVTIDKGHNLQMRIQQLKDKLICIHAVKDVLFSEASIANCDGKVKVTKSTLQFIELRICFLENPRINSFLKLVTKRNMYERVSFFAGDIFCAVLKRTRGI